MRSFEPALKLETCEATYPEDIYLSAYENLCQKGFSDPGVLSPIYVSIDSAEIQRLSETIAEDLPGLELPLQSSSQPSWERSDGFDEVWHTDDIEYLFVLEWARALVEPSHRYELLRLLMVSIGDVSAADPLGCSPLYGYYAAKEKATDRVTAFIIEPDEDRTSAIRIVEGRERHGLLGKLLLARNLGSPPLSQYPGREIFSASFVEDAKVLDEYL